MCFKEKVKELVYYKHRNEIGDFVSEKHAKLIEKAKDISDFIDFNSVSEKIKKASFLEYYSIENIMLFKDFLITELKEFEKFSQKWRDGWQLAYNGEIMEYNWFGVVGKESYHSFAYVLTESIIHNTGFDNAQKKLKELGIPFESGGGTASHYRILNLLKFKPLMLQVVGYLEKLK